MKRALPVLLLSSLCWSQQLHFEVATIKPSRPDSLGSNFNRRPGGGIECLNVTLREMILFAYDIRPHELTGGPPWLDKDRYDVLAKPDRNDNPTGAKRSFDDDFREIRLRMRSLLADRFQVAIHTETRELPIYALLVAKGGPHLQKSTTEDLGIHNRNGFVECTKVTMKDFAESSLTYRMGRTVVDETGLTDEFDFELKFVEDQALAADTSGPDFLTALQQQLGLKLESRKGPVQVYVVDRAEKPTAN
jgi:uncharacterized protein (TIGR03435 family)